MNPIPGVAAFLLPVLAMVVLTFGVATLLLRRRIGEMRTRRIHPQAVASARDMAAKLDDSRAADNFRNLFETPVLFYVAILAALVMHAASWWILAAAWIFVAARFAHSFIHCTYNKVRHRFYAFFASMAALAVIWLLLGWRIVAMAVLP
jgi:hypothetical protein